MYGDCPYCYRPKGTWKHDPILLPNGAEYDWISDSELVYVSDKEDRWYKGIQQIREDEVQEIQDSLKNSEGENLDVGDWTNFSPLNTSGKFQITGKHLKEMRDSIEKLIDVIGLTKIDYFNYDEKDNHIIHPNGDKIEWTDPITDATDLEKFQVKYIHIEDLRHYISSIWSERWDISPLQIYINNNGRINYVPGGSGVDIPLYYYPTIGDRGNYYSTGEIYVSISPPGLPYNIEGGVTYGEIIEHISDSSPSSKIIRLYNHFSTDVHAIPPLMGGGDVDIDIWNNVGKVINFLITPTAKMSLEASVIRTGTANEPTGYYGGKATIQLIFQSSSEINYKVGTYGHVSTRDIYLPTFGGFNRNIAADFFSSYGYYPTILHSININISNTFHDVPVYPPSPKAGTIEFTVDNIRITRK